MNRVTTIAIQTAAVALLVVEYFLYCGAYRHSGQWLFGLCCALLALFLSAFLQEAGHALAARAVGWRVVVFAVRPFAVRLVDLSFAVGRWRLSNVQGLVTAIPSRREDGTSRNWSIILASGPLTCLFVAVATLVSAVTWLPHFDGPVLLTSFLAYGFALRCFSAFLFAMLPSAREGVTSVGSHLRALGRQGFDFDAGRPLIWLLALMRANVRLRDWPDWLMSDAQRSSAGKQEAEKLLAGMELARFLDQPSFDQTRARQMLEEYRGKYGADEWFTAVDAYFTAVYEADPGSAGMKLDGCPRPLKPIPMFLAAEAAVAAAKGERKLAERQLRSMMKALKAESMFMSSSYLDLRRQVRALALSLKGATSL